MRHQSDSSAVAAGGRRLGHVISDLHLFAHRSTADDHLPRLHEALPKSEFLVLNGDIFDFKWSRLPSMRATLNAATSWLQDLVERHPECLFHYVLGNHDGLRVFAEELDALAQRLPNLSWHPSHVRLGSNLFLHGDLPLSTRSHATVRQLRAVERQKTPRAGAAYHALCRSGVLRSLHVVHPPRRTVRRLTKRLRHASATIFDGVSDVYFGHTHLDFSGVEFGGLRYHNTGSTVAGLRCNMMRVVA